MTELDQFHSIVRAVTSVPYDATSISNAIAKVRAVLAHDVDAQEKKTGHDRMDRGKSNRSEDSA